METLNIGIDSWIIQDGNYGNFVVGQDTKFAIEFYPLSLIPSECKEFSITELKTNQYKICGQVIFCADEVWVLDFGFLAFQESKPLEFATKGSWVEGEISLGIDPFFYFEYLKKLPNMPSLTYKFRIEKILLETTPWIKMSDRKMLIRDIQSESFQEVNKTDAWNDDNGHAGYILKCSIDKKV